MTRILNFFFLPDLLRYHNFLGKLIYRDFFERYVGSALGFLWAIINPLVLIGMYVLLFAVILQTRFASLHSPVEYGLFFFCGLIPWLSFQESILKASEVLLKYRSLILQVPLPLGFFPLHLAITSLIAESITCLIFLVFVLFIREWSVLHLSLLPMLFVCRFFLVAGLNLLISALGVLYRDLTQGLHLLLLILFFLTPIVYPSSQIPESWLNILQVNPLFHLVNAYRYCLLGEGLQQNFSLLWLLISSLCVYTCGRVIFHYSAKRARTLL